MLSSYMSNAWAGGIVAFPAKATRQTWYSFISPVGSTLAIRTVLSGYRCVCLTRI